MFVRVLIASFEILCRVPRKNVKIRLSRSDTIPTDFFNNHVSRRLIR